MYVTCHRAVRRRDVFSLLSADSTAVWPRASPTDSSVCTAQPLRCSVSPLLTSLPTAMRTAGPSSLRWVGRVCTTSVKLLQQIIYEFIIMMFRICCYCDCWS